jgi:hypothetical protein
MDGLLAAVSSHIAHDAARNSTLNVKQSQRLRAVDANNAFELVTFYCRHSTPCETRLWKLMMTGVS